MEIQLDKNAYQAFSYLIAGKEILQTKRGTYKIGRDGVVKKQTFMELKSRGALEESTKVAGFRHWKLTDFWKTECSVVLQHKAAGKILSAHKRAIKGAIANALADGLTQKQITNIVTKTFDIL
jgi:hypothetical protein